MDRSTATDRGHKETHRWLEYCQILEVPHLVFHSIGPKGRSLKEIMKTIELDIQAFKGTAKSAEDWGLKPVLENAGSLGEISGIKEVVDGIGSASIGICLDTGHANMDGLNLEETIYECGD